MENYFAKNLEFLRENKLVNVREISETLGFSKSQWSNWEKGRALPKLEDFIRLVQFINTTESAILHTDFAGESAPDQGFSDSFAEKCSAYQRNNKDLTRLQQEIALLNQSIADKNLVIQLLKEKIEGLEAQVAFPSVRKSAVAKPSGNKL